RRTVQPLHPVELRLWQPLPQVLALPLAHVRAGLQDRVARRHRVHLRQPVDRIARKAPAAPAHLDEVRVGTQLAQHRRHRLGHALGEQRAQLRRGDEVAGGTELGRPGAVIAQPRRIQRQLHEAPERDRPAGGLDLAADQRLQALAVGARFRVNSGFRHAHSLRKPASRGRHQSPRIACSRCRSRKAPGPSPVVAKRYRAAEYTAPSALWNTPSSSTRMKNSPPTRIASPIQACAASTVSSTPASTVPAVITQNAAPMPTVPIALSPQVRLNSATLSLSASIGPTSRLTSTGTTRKVARVQATPRPLPIRRTMKLF